MNPPSEPCRAHMEPSALSSSECAKSMNCSGCSSGEAGATGPEPGRTCVPVVSSQLPSCSVPHAWVISGTSHMERAVRSRSEERRVGKEGGGGGAGGAGGGREGREVGGSGRGGER